jgi:hypothetical protein
MSYQGSFLPPGQLPSIESIEQDLTSVIWNRLELQVIGSNALISGAARDAGNTGFTDVLRPGLLLTKDADGKFVEWGSVTSFVADTIEGVMLMAQRVTRLGTNQDRFLGYILLGGCVKVNGLIVPGETAAGIAGNAQETNIRTQMKYAFRFDDDPLSHLAT